MKIEITKKDIESLDIYQFVDKYRTDPNQQQDELKYFDLEIEVHLHQNTDCSIMFRFMATSHQELLNGTFLRWICNKLDMDPIEGIHNIPTRFHLNGVKPEVIRNSNYV